MKRNVPLVVYMLCGLLTVSARHVVMSCLSAPKSVGPSWPPRLAVMLKHLTAFASIQLGGSMLTASVDAKTTGTAEVSAKWKVRADAGTYPWPV